MLATPVWSQLQHWGKQALATPLGRGGRGGEGMGDQKRGRAASSAFPSLSRGTAGRRSGEEAGGG